MLILTLAIPALAQTATPPAADPLPAEANPFLNAVTVTLSSPAASEIWWSTTGTGDLAPGEGTLYAGPINITQSATLRTVAVFNGMGQDPQTANFSYVKDTKPSVALSSPANGATFTTGETITLKSTVTDAEGGPYAVDYYRSGGTGGWTKLNPASLQTAPFEYAWDLGALPPTGTVQLRAIAADQRGLTDTSIISVSISPPNHAPTVSLGAQPNNPEPVAPASFTLNATATDDGAVAKVEFYQDGVLIGTDIAGPTWSLAVSSLSVGSYSFTAKAFDNGTPALSTISAPLAINVVPNKPPSVAITSPANDAGFSAPASFPLVASASDSDGTIARVVFYQDTDSIGIGTSGTTGYTLQVTNRPVGTFKYTAKAVDNLGASKTSAGITVKITNTAPSITLTSPLTGTYTATYAATLTAKADDPGGSVQKVDFFVSGVLDKTIITPATGGIYSYQKSFATPGAYAIRARATDNLGDTSVATATVTVVANLKPTAKVAKDTGLVVLPISTYSLNGSGSTDPENETLTYAWSGPSGVAFNNAAAANPIATFTGGGGTYAIKLVVTDPRGLSDDTTVNMQVWAKPAITSDLNPAAVANQNFSYVIRASGFPAPTYGASALPSWLTYNASTATLSGKPTSQGTFKPNITATNAVGAVTQVLTITVGDSLHKASITSSLNATGKTGTGFSYTITASGNPTVTTFGATGLPAGLGISGATISGTPTASGNFTVSLTASNSLGEDKKNLALTVNEDPRITRDLPDSLPTVYEKTSVSFSVQAAGFPGVSYQWQFSLSPTANFGPVGTGSSATYTINPTSTANTGYYRVIVKNSVGEVTSKACRLKVNPIPAPVKISQSPTPQTAVVGDKVFFKAKATGEPLPLLYRWFRGVPPNRVAITTAKADDTVLTLDAVQVAMNDFYSVRATSSNFPGDSANPAYSAWSDTARLTVQLPKLAKPAALPAGGTIYQATQVTLTNPPANASIWYTLNGQDPVAGAPSIQYLGGTISIDSTRTLKAKAFGNQYRPSDVMTEVYTFTAPNKSAKPSIWPVDSTFRGSLPISITASEGSEIYYSLESADSSAYNLKYTDSVYIRRTTTVKAVATKPGFLPSDTAIRVYTLEKPKSTVLDPQFTPDGGSFIGSLLVKIASQTPGALVHFTDNGNDPDSTSPIATERGIQITKSTTLKAIGILKDFVSSPVITRDFRLGPGNIAASPDGDLIFDDEVTVKLSVTPASAVIRYTLDGSAPSPESPIYPPEGKSFATTVTITAVAYLDGQPGSPQTFSYTRKGGPLITPIPITAGNAFSFKDTLLVTLLTTPGAKVYYTIDGSEPSFIAANLYKQPIFLKNTATLQAVAVADGFENSKVLVATYTLVPEKPVIKPPGGSYPLPFTAQIYSSSRAASIYYTLDGKPPTPDHGTLYVRGTDITIDTAGSLRAVAVAGNMASEISTEEYGAVSLIDTILDPGKTLFLYGGYTLRNPEDQSASVKVHTGSPTNTGITGFEGVQYTLKLALANPTGSQAQAFPKLAFTTPASEKRYLYKIEASGKIFFVSSGDSVTLSAGTWFMGNDTMPPRIKYLSEAYDANDSTQVVFEVTDNVANLGYTLLRNDNPARNVTGAFLFSDQAITARLKHPDGILKPLYVKVSVSDFQKSASFPANDNSMLPLSQKLKPLQGPAAWKIGVRQENRYDFVSVPLALDPPLTLEALRGLNPTAQVEGAEFQNSDNKFHAMAAGTALLPGHGYWLASRASVTSLQMASAATASSGGKSAFSVNLRHGWNQISNPNLETLYWPSGWLLDGYRSFLVKGLWAWDPTLAKPDYAKSDSLLPWRGYFAWNWGGDTVIPLLPRPPLRSGSTPPPTAAAKPSAAGRIQISMGWDGRSSLSLGADPLSSDGFGVEDEVSLPQQGDRFLRIVRNGRSLASDWVRLDRAGAQTWVVQFGSAGDTLPSLRVADLLLPAGDEAWAVSRSRGMKFALVPGASIPASGLAQDSLIVMAGPKEALASLLDGLSATAPQLDAKLAPAAEGFRLRLGLPSRARIKAILWSLQGTRLGTLSTGLLSEGAYEFGFTSDFGNRPARLGPGMYVLTVDVRGQDLSARLTKKLLLAR
jgi:hypothetical protein